MSAPKMVYLAIIFSFVFQPLLAPLAYALEGDDTILDNGVPSAPAGGLPTGETMWDTSFSFMWAAPKDETGVTYQLRIASDRAQVESAPDTSLAWYSPHLMEAHLPAAMVPNLRSGVWYWQVRAMDALGNKSTWSDAWTVTVDVSGPEIEIARPLKANYWDISSYLSGPA